MKLPTLNQPEITYIVSDTNWRRLGVIKATCFRAAKELARQAYPSYRYITLSNEGN